MTRIVLAEDHAIVRGGLRQMLALEPGLSVVAEAADGAQLLSVLRDTACDLLLTDLNMPGLSGPDLIERVKAHYPDLPVLVLSMHDSAHIAARAMKAGAAGYVTKDCEPDVLLEAVRKVAAGKRFIAPEMAEKMALLSTTPSGSDLIGRLSDRELEVMRWLVKGSSVNEIAAQLCISNKTVSTHKTNLMEKLGVRSLADLMRYAIENRLLDA